MTSEPSLYAVKRKVPNLVFYGGAGAGKSTAADYVCSTYDSDKISFARLLKELAVKLWGDDAFNDRDKLQKFGTMLRELDEDVWCRPVFAAIDENLASESFPDDVWVNDDCRFPNEYWGLKERNFVFVRVLAKEEIRIDRLLRNGKLDDISQLEHASETALTGLDAIKAGIVDDYTLFNNESHEDLYRGIEQILIDCEERA